MRVGAGVADPAFDCSCAATCCITAIISGVMNVGAGLAVRAVLLKPSNGSEDFALKSADGAGDDFVAAGCLSMSSAADAAPKPDIIARTPTEPLAADTYGISAIGVSRGQALTESEPVAADEIACAWRWIICSMKL